MSSPSTPAQPGILSSGARKAQVAAAIAFLGPLLTFVVATGEWDWRAFVGAVLSGVVAALTTYQTGNAGYTYTGGPRG